MRFNKEAGRFNYLLQRHRLQKGKLFFLDHSLERLPPGHVLAADSIHPTGASAHFRFKEQQDWQDEPAELSEFLSIDCDRIVDALLTIPLHERLDLPEDIFPANVIQQFRDEAAACSEKYEAFLRTGKRQVKTVPDVGESLKNSLQAAIIAAAKPKPKPKDDDDLEELLNLSLKSPWSDNPPKDKSKDEDERDLEFLLSLKEDHNEKEPQKPTVDLEDWLDSVLQD
ncbi:hypothetical protein HPB50_024349 [Hyalomma asiaticum]|uniref:Uncharacterized protein n=1 Tax=Hyalomma asiaticum TaxID=266040 RepID=A0ACB7RZS9_HYAAI|nr:hypothetical protein HPB50_024349 [Hyalomma asiaticum]